MLRLKPTRNAQQGMCIGADEDGPSFILLDDFELVADIVQKSRAISIRSEAQPQINSGSFETTRLSRVSNGSTMEHQWMSAMRSAFAMKGLEVSFSRCPLWFRSVCGAVENPVGGAPESRCPRTAWSAPVRLGSRPVLSPSAMRR